MNSIAVYLRVSTNEQETALVCTDWLRDAHEGGR